MWDNATLRCRCTIAQAIGASITAEIEFPDRDLGGLPIIEDALNILGRIRSNMDHPAAHQAMDWLTTRFAAVQDGGGAFSKSDLAYTDEVPPGLEVIHSVFALQLLSDAPSGPVTHALQQALIDQTEKCLLKASQEDKDHIHRILEEIEAGQFGRFDEVTRVPVLVALSVSYISKASPADSAPISCAMEHLEEAKTLAKLGQSAAISALTHLIQGRAFLRRHDGDRSSDLESALHSFNCGLDLPDSGINPVRRASAAMELGTVYSERVLENRDRNLQKAIECYESALDVFDETETQTQWAHAHINLGNVYQWLTQGDLTENQRLAAKNYHTALRVLDQETSPLAWMVATMNLASLMLWQTDGGRSNNIETAIELYNSLSETLSGDGSEYDLAFIEFNLGVAHVERLQENRVANLEAATRYMEAALNKVTQEVSPHQHAVWKLNLAATYQHLFTYDRRRDQDLTKAIELGKECLLIDELKTDTRNFARLNNNLGVAYKDLATYKFPKHWDAAEKHLVVANELMSHFDASIEFQQPLVELADLHLRKHQWEEAVSFSTAAIENIEATSLSEATTDGGRHHVFGRIAEVASIAAYSQLRLGQVDAALATLEHSRARLMAESLRIDPPGTVAERAGIAAHAGAETTASFDHEWMPTSLPANTTFVVIFSTMVGGAAVLLHGSEGKRCSTSICWLDELRQNQVEELLNGSSGRGSIQGWIPSYRQAFGEDSSVELQLVRRWATAGEATTDRAYQVWNDTVGSQSKELWRIVAGPIDEALISLGLVEGANIVLLPPGTLSLMPLHAARGRVGEKEQLCFGDLWSVSYAPSLKSLFTSARRISERAESAQTLLAIAEPQRESKDVSPLPGSQSELGVLRRYFDDRQTRILSGSEATRTAVLSALSAAKYIHASCHGTYDWEEPNQSGLALVGGERLTLSDLIGGTELKNNRLFFASACETGFKDLERAPDEFLGVSAGLMQAGAPNVVGTLWPVFDDAAFLLSRQFYKALFEEDGPAFDSPARALREAQAWLRNVTFGFLAEEFGTVEIAGKTMIALPYSSKAAVFSSRLNASDKGKIPETEASSSSYEVEEDTGVANALLVPMGDEHDKPYENPHEWAAFFVYGP